MQEPANTFPTVGLLLFGICFHTFLSRVPYVCGQGPGAHAPHDWRVWRVLREAQRAWESIFQAHIFEATVPVLRVALHGDSPTGRHIRNPAVCLFLPSWAQTCQLAVRSVLVLESAVLLVLAIRGIY